MKPNKIIRAIAGICAALIMASCAEDKTYELGGLTFKNVNFTATNLALDSTLHVSSTSYDWYYGEEEIRKIPYDLYFPYTYNGTDMVHEERSAVTYMASQLWSGGYNDILVTFIPSAPEEKEATFTMPDGKTITATADRPSFIWTPDKSLADRYYGGGYESFIKADSRYSIGNKEYINHGFVNLELDTDVRYNPDNGRWYQLDWLSNDLITVDGYTKFTAKNLTVTEQDTCTSYNRYFPSTEFPYSDSIVISYFGYGGSEHVEEWTNTVSYYLYVCGNNDVLFTFEPQKGEKEMTLTLPNYSKVTLTAENPTYIWHVTQEDAWNYDYSWISAESTYTWEGITYKCESEMRMVSIYGLYYDPESGIFRSDIRN